MRRLRAVFLRFTSLFHRRRQEREMAEELDSNLQMHIEDNLRAGMSPDEARRHAAIKLGGLEQAKEIYRDRRSLPAVETLAKDLRYALRQLARSPGFTFVAVLTLGLGIGANTAVFSVMNAALLRYLPVPNPQQLFYVQTTGFPGGGTGTGSPDLSFNEPSFDLLRNEHRAFSDLMAYVPMGFGKVPVRYGEEPEEAGVDMVSGNFFTGLGVRAECGRTFRLEDETKHSLVAVLSEGYWSRRFGRDPSVVGQTLYIKGVPFTILGVAVHDFIGVERGRTTDLWVPFQARPELNAWGVSAETRRTLYGAPDWWFLMMVGRLAPGVTAKQGAAQLQPLFERSAYEGIGARKPKENPPRIYLMPLRGAEGPNSGFESALHVLMAMVMLVLLIACINVALLLVARNSARQREFSVRLALGAGGTHFFRQMLTESALLVAAGGALGWAFAVASTRVLASWAELDFSVTPDRAVLGFTLVISALAALAFGLAPLREALRARAALTLKSSAATTYQERGRLRGGRFLVALQISLGLTLLVSAGLLLRTLRNLQTTKLGLHAQGLLVFGITPPPALHTGQEVKRFFVSLTERFRSLPEVESVTLMENRLGTGWSNNGPAFVDGTEARYGKSSVMRWNAVGPEYFRVLGTPLLLGRDITDADTSSAPDVTIVNETFADRYLRGRNPLGHQVSMCASADCGRFSIVGVAANGKYTGVRESDLPMAYFPYQQLEVTGTLHFELRTRGIPTALLAEVRRVVREFGPDIPLLQPMTQQAQFEETYSDERLFARLSTFFGLLAALLVATGLYGTLAYRVNRRTPELGVRMALGAQRQQVLWMVLRESLLISLAGTAVGLPLAIGAGRLLRSQLFGLRSHDPLTIAGALGGMFVVALIASYLPALRATKVDPLVALRYE